MQYAEAKVGRIFYVRIDHGEDLIAMLEDFVSAKLIDAGIIHFLGALREGRMVTGPVQPVVPPGYWFESYAEGWEVIGLGTIARGHGGPHIHLHASVGKHRQALTGCLRERATAYLVIEAIIIEMVGIGLTRHLDPVAGIELTEPGPVHPR